MNSGELIDLFANVCSKYPIISIEDQWQKMILKVLLR